MSSKKVNEKGQAMKKMVRITMEVKKEIVEKYEGGMRIRDLAAAYRMPRTTVSTIVKNEDVIKSANIAKGVKSITKQRSGKFLDRFLVNVKPGDPQPGPSREKRQKREN
jgi:transposase-like protein